MSAPPSFPPVGRRRFYRLLLQNLPLLTVRPLLALAPAMLTLSPPVTLPLLVFSALQPALRPLFVCVRSRHLGRLAIFRSHGALPLSAATSLNGHREFFSDSVVLFWKPPSGFSNWTASSFTVLGVRYVSGEQYLMSEKARLSLPRHVNLFPDYGYSSLS